MRMSTRSRKARLAGAALAVGLVATACGGDDDGSSGDDNEPITLTIDTFGNFGYEELVKEYAADNDNIAKVELRTAGDQVEHHDTLAQRLAAGSGAGDIVAIEEGSIVRFRATPDQFQNLLDYGAGDIMDRWLPWKWEQSMTSDGNFQLGLGTDIGSLAMCYRTDLFEQAGLPTNRDEVSALWADGGWEAFIAAGRQFKAATPDVAWFDTSTNLYNPIVWQQDQGYFDESDNLIVESNPGIKKAWDLTVKALQETGSSGLQSFSPEWNGAFQTGAFATIACPAWMLGYIQENAPDAEGLWDIAAVPGDGGNWGGSFLAIPEQSDNPEEAYELAAWLTAPEQQLRIFKDVGNLPSTPELYSDPAVTGFTNSFFNDAPVGEIFAASAEELQPQYLGTENNAVRTAFENAMREVEAGNLSPEDGWNRAVDEATKEVED